MGDEVTPESNGEERWKRQSARKAVEETETGV